MTWQDKFPGWRELGIGEQIQDGDRYFHDCMGYPCDSSVGGFYKTTSKEFGENYFRTTSQQHCAIVITQRPKPPPTLTEHSSKLTKNRLKGKYYIIVKTAFPYRGGIGYCGEDCERAEIPIGKVYNDVWDAATDKAKIDRLYLPLPSLYHIELYHERRTT